MQIDSIGKGYQGPLALVPSPATDRASAASSGVHAPADSGGNAGSVSFHEILAHYDVTHITPRSGADYGEVRWDADVRNHDGEAVATYDVLTLVAGTWPTTRPDEETTA